MEIFLHFRHFPRPETRVQKYAEQKLSRLKRFNKDIMEAHVDIASGKERTAPDKYRASVNLHLPPKHILRAEAKGQTPEAAIDLVYEELERQIEKHSHEKRLSRKERKQRKIIGQFEPEEETE